MSNCRGHPLPLEGFRGNRVEEQPHLLPLPLLQRHPVEVDFVETCEDDDEGE